MPLPMVTLIARRPILDSSDRVYAYSMAFRAAEGAPALPTGMDVDPARGARKAFREFHLRCLADRHPIFIPLEVGSIVRGAAKGLPADDVVICIAAAPGAGEELVEAVARLADAGFRIAASDEGTGRVDPALLAHASFVFLDPSAVAGENGEPRWAAVLEGRGVRTVATQVADAEARQQAADAGFTLFNGSFLAAPPLGNHPLPRCRNGATMLALIAELNDPDFDLERAHRLIRTDPALSYMLLRYINSAFFSLPRDVESIRQAVMLLGSDHIRRFVSIVALARLGEARPDELLRVAVLRARLCELLAPRRGPELFTAGLFSVLDALLGVPMDRALEGLPLSSELRQALLAGRGPLAPYLALARAYHEGRWSRVTRLVRRLKLDVVRMPTHYREAVGWADAVFEIRGEE